MLRITGAGQLPSYLHLSRHVGKSHHSQECMTYVAIKIIFKLSIGIKFMATTIGFQELTGWTSKATDRHRAALAFADE